MTRVFHSNRLIRIQWISYEIQSNLDLQVPWKEETSNRIFLKKIKKLFKTLFLTTLPLKNAFQTKPLYSRNLNPWQCIDNERRIHKLIRVTTELNVFPLTVNPKSGHHPLLMTSASLSEASLQLWCTANRTADIVIPRFVTCLFTHSL